MADPQNLETLMRHLITPVPLAKIKTSDTIKYWRGYEFIKPVMHHMWEYLLVRPLRRSLAWSPISDQLHILCSSNSTPRWIPKPVSNTCTKKTHTQMRMCLMYAPPWGRRWVEFYTASKQYGSISWKKQAPENDMHDTVTGFTHAAAFINWKELKQNWMLL